MTAKLKDADRTLGNAIRMYDRILTKGTGKLTEDHIEALRTNKPDGVDLDRAEELFRESKSRKAGNDNREAKTGKCIEYPSVKLGEHYDPKTNPAPIRMTMKELMSSTFKDRPYIVQDLLPMGCIMLVGAPKVGKSWFVYQLARCIDAGVPFLGRKVKRGKVIYFALEDGMQRLQQRAASQVLEGCEEFSDDLVLQTELPKAGAGGMDELRAFLDANPGTSLVVIDVLKMFRNDRKGKSNAYDDDYADIQPIKRLAQEYDCCIILVHHTNKGNEKAIDPFDRISGTGGIAGAADGTILLVPDSERRMGIYGRGRDFKEFDIPLSFNDERKIWEEDNSDRDAPDTSSYSELTAKILKALAMENGNPINPKKLALLVDMDADEVSRRLGKLEKSGKATKLSRGQWVLSGKEPRSYTQ